MTQYELSHELYHWLSEMQVVSGNYRYKLSGNFELDQKTADMLLSGYSLMTLIIKIAKQQHVKINEALLASMKNSNTLAARIYNWNILQESFNKINLPLAKMTQKQIIAGNFHKLIQLLQMVKQQLNPIKKNLILNSEKSLEQYEDIKDINISIAKQASSTFELIVFLIIKHLGLNFKQALQSLKDNANAFSHIVVKGLKNSFIEIMNFYEQISEQIPQIVYLSERNPEKNTQFFLRILKISIISRQQQVARIGSIILQKFVEESLKYNTKNIVYQILCKQTQGFDFIYLGLKRHPLLAQYIYSFIYKIVQSAFYDFFVFHFKRTISDEAEYIKTIIMLLPQIVKQQGSKKSAYQSKTIESWINLCKEQKQLHIRINKQQITILYLQLLSQLLKNYYKEFQSQAKFQNVLVQVVQQLKKNTRKEKYIIKISAFLRLFDLLQYLAEKKNHIAALILRIIIFLFVQNHHDIQIREVILNNFCIILHKFPTIPIELLIEPLLKQISIKQGKSYILNIFDFQFILQICKHPRMETTYALQFLQYCTRLYVKSILYARLILRIIKSITDRFCEQQMLRQFLLSNTVENLNIYSMITFGKKLNNKQEIILNKQKKALIIELIKHYINLSHIKLNEDIQQRILTIHVKWIDERNYKDKGLLYLLELLGDVDQMIIKLQRIRQKHKLQREMQNSKRYDTISYSIGQDNYIKSMQISDINSQRYLRKGYSPNLFINQQKNVKFLQPNNYKSLEPLDRMDSQAIRRKLFRPSPKVIQDLQKIKQRLKISQYKKIMDNQKTQRKNNQKVIWASNQLLKRNVSFGYSKLPQLQEDRLLLQFNTAKVKHMKQQPIFINLQQEEDREQETVQHILHKYKKIKIIFNQYALASADKNGKNQMIVSFTEIIRMLNDKGLSRIPKISIKQVMAIINQRSRKQSNLIAGIYQKDFDIFLVQLTHILNKVDKNSKDYPFGLKLEQFLQLLCKGQQQVRHLNDPEILKYNLQVSKNNEQESTPQPQGYKKTQQIVLQLVFSLGLKDTKINQNFLDCYHILGQIYQKAMKTNLLCPRVQYVEKQTIVSMQRYPKLKICSQSGQRPISKKDQRRLFRLRQQNSQKHNIADKNLCQSLSNQQYTSPKKISQKSNRKYDFQQKQKLKTIKQQNNFQQDEKKIKQQQNHDKQKIKQQNHKKYLQENKKKVQAYKQKKEKDNTAKKLEQEQNQEQDRKFNKLKQLQLLEKEKYRIRMKTQAIEKYKKNKQQASPSKNQKITDEVLKRLSQRKKQKYQEIAVKQSISNGQINSLLKKYEQPLNELFESYWNHNKKKIQLNSLSLLLRDFNITPEYILPQTIEETYKIVSKGVPLDFNNFKQFLARISLKIEKQISKHLKSKIKEKNDNNPEQHKINQTNLQFLLEKLQINQPNYKMVVQLTKQHLK